MIRPLGDKVVVEPKDDAAKTAGGIFLPDTAKKKPQEGVVIAVGPGRILEDGTNAKMNVKAGDVVIFSKYGGNLGENGCVAWMFKKKAVFTVDKETFDDEDTLMEIAMDAGAEDFTADEDAFEITADPDDFNAIEQVLADKGIETANAEITQVPDTTVALNDNDAEKLQKLLDALDEDDDVQNVYGNYDL